MRIDEDRFPVNVRVLSDVHRRGELRAKVGPMKPSRIHYFFAEEWPARLWLMTGPVLEGLFALRACHPTLALLGDWSSIPRWVGISVLGLLLAFFAPILLGWFVIAPLYYIRSVDNGEPFREGDLVHILVGHHRDRVVRVLETQDIAPWAGAHRVRVDLGTSVGKDGEDVFRSYQILLVARDEPEPDPESTRGGGEAG
jgi:hypothetical protein